MAPRHTQSAPTRHSRRHFLHGMFALGVGATGLVAFSKRADYAPLAVDEVTLVIPGIAPSLDGKRLAQLSDFHLSEHTGPELLSHATTLVAESGAEWLVLTGDYVGGEAGYAAGLVEPLAALDIPIMAVMGNHDYGTHLPTVTRHLVDAGVRVLTNDAVDVGDGLWVAGLDDVWFGQPNLRAALQDVPSRAGTILLVHEPDYFDTVIREDAPITLQLSGHSHGGQIRLPSVRADEAGNFSFAPVLPPMGRRYPIGLRTVGDRNVYTNRGLGGWPITTRINCPPELTLFTLRSA